MQISVVKPDESNIQKLQEIISYVYRAYGVQSVEAYIVKDDGELGFVFYGDEMNMYVNNKKDGLEFTAFQLDEDERLTYVGNTEYRIFFEPNGSMQVVAAKELVPGDIVVLETGDYIPADLRIIEAVNLKSQEAALTGESLAVEKQVDAKIIEIQQNQNIFEYIGAYFNSIFKNKALVFTKPIMHH